MKKRKFIPQIGQKVMIINNIDGLTIDNIRNQQTIENVSQVQVDDVEDGILYVVDLENIPFIFDEFDLEPVK